LKGLCGILAAATILTGPAVGFQQTVGPTGGDVDKGEVALAVDEYLRATGAGTERSGWERAFERLVFYGDFRLRGESTLYSDDTEDRHRGRLGANYRVLDNLIVGARLVTGDPNDARSTHWTLGDEFDDVEVNLDRLFVQWKPSQSTELRGGKFDWPVQRNPVYGELLWDADVQPEGAAGVFERTHDGVLQRAGMAIAAYVYEERAATTDANLYSGSVWGRFRAGEDGTVGLSAEYATFRGLLPLNVAPGAGVDYDLLHPLADAVVQVRGKPPRFGLETFHNLAETGSAAQGWAAGGAVGSFAEAGDWVAYYQYQDIGALAVFAPPGPGRLHRVGRVPGPPDRHQLQAHPHGRPEPLGPCFDARRRRIARAHVLPPAPRLQRQALGAGS
jgi:hypothetical protein